MSEIKRTGFLFEIGTDELPARFLPVEQKHVEKTLAVALTELRLPYEALQVFVAPRRLAILIDGLAASQEDVTIEIKGPPAKVAFDDDGKPTNAAIGFARKNGIDVSNLYEIDDGKGQFVGAKKYVPGKSAAELLTEKIPEILKTIPFPKTMRWGRSDFVYARPIQWLVALLGTEVVPVEFGSLSAGRLSRGHRTLALGREISIDSSDSYLTQLQDNFVIVNQNLRMEIISKGISEALSNIDNAKCMDDQDLLIEVANICEYPTPFVGSFSEDFFELPDEVIVTALKSHQRYFSVEKKDAHGLLPYFVAVRDGGSEALDNVRHGNEKVLRARLSDALFYWEFDQRQTPDEHMTRLSSVTWVEGYGSMLDKVERVRKLVDWIWKNGAGVDEMPADLVRAAEIYKFDLVTEMIKDGKEFTKLEGLIGARYAAAAKESSQACEILQEYNRPRSAGDEVSENKLASILSIAERIDTLVGCWLAGFSPTGAKDAYALRRHTLSTLRIMAAHNLHLNIPELLAAALVSYPESDNNDNAIQEMEKFVSTRLLGYFENLGYEGDVVRAVLPTHGQDPVDALKWVEALAAYRSKDDFVKLATGFKRCRNILGENVLRGQDRRSSPERWGKGGMSPKGVNFDSLPEPAEISLRDSVRSKVSNLTTAESEHDYNTVFSILSGLGPAIDYFFDSVRVNTDNEELTSIRHDFLREVHSLFARYADFSEVVPSD
jgi:glycyl-tRNA synthetase beta chain